MDTVNLMTTASMRAAMAARIPVMLVGAPGTGKTASVRYLAKEMGYTLLTVIGSMMDPTDMIGLPQGQEVEIEDKKIWATVNLSPAWQVEILTRKRVILFLDEFSNTSGATRAAMLTMLQNREFPNGEKMPEETIVIGAMNPTEEAADGYELDAPTTNRILFLVWRTSAESWYKGMLDGWGENLSQAEMKWKNTIVKCIRDNPSMLHVPNTTVNSSEVFGINSKDPSEMEVLRYAWPSRRSWDNLSKVLAHAGEDVSIQDEISKGLVGYSAAAKLREWMTLNAEISLQDVMNDPSIVEWDELTPNQMSLYLREIADNFKVDEYQSVVGVLLAVAKARRQAEAGAYMTDILKRMRNFGLNAAQEAEFRESSQKLLKEYKGVGKSSQGR